MFAIVSMVGLRKVSSSCNDLQNYLWSLRFGGPKSRVLGLGYLKRLVLQSGFCCFDALHQCGRQTHGQTGTPRQHMPRLQAAPDGKCYVA